MRMPSLGEDFGRYRLESELGRGGMGIVYAARDTSLDRLVALKIITPQWAEDAEYRARFEREALSLSRVESPHVVAVHDYGELDGCLYLVTQIVPDGDLLQLLRREGALAPAVALDVVGQVLDGLGDAHGVGVVHRDVKPSNVLLRRRDGRLQAVLCDFGIATSAGGDVTRTGALVGSFPYMAPERHQGEQADGAADVYSVGCVLWQTLTGTAPYVGSDVEVAMAHLQAPLPQLPAADDFSRAINLILTRALAKDPAERYPSARAMTSDLVSAASLAPGALELPDVTSIRHVIVPGVVAGASGGGGAGGGTGTPPALAEESGRSPRRPLVAVLAAAIAVLLAVVGTYAVVAATAGERSVELSGVAGAASPASSAPVPSETGESTASDEASDEPSGASTRKGGSATKGRRGRQGSGSTGGSGNDSDAGVVTDPGALTDPGTGDPGASEGDGSGSGGGTQGGKGGGKQGGEQGGEQGGKGGGNPGPRGDDDTQPNKPPQQTPAPTPTPPPPPTFRCWNGDETYGYDECPALSGRAGLEWVYPNNYSCVSDPTVGGPRLVILTCQRKTRHGRGEIRYTLWKSVAAATDYFSGQNGSASEPWKGDWGYTWFRETPQNELKYQRTNVYAREPVSVVVRGVNLKAHQQIVGTVMYRPPANRRGAPL
ncbi:serine/threonine-protein kinase [Nocardioides sp.]|uniref:serine/threonine-protein kinase n=1 Tax=Nocardioides sp. TaxID=35761 RepID=UPI0032195BE5